MLHGFTNLRLPPYASLKQYEGKGNYAISKYYRFPHSFFYRKKLKMIVSLMEKDKIYHNILDYGSGPGIFTDELKKHALFIKNFEIKDIIDPRWRFDAIVCSSVLEFCHLSITLQTLRSILNTNGKLFIGSPMNTKLSLLYFRCISNKESRHSHFNILSEVSKHFRIEEYHSWMNLYFALRASRN